MDLKRIYDYMTGRPETYKGLKDVGYDDFEKSMGDARYRRGVYNQLYINGGINSKYDVFEGSWQKTYGEPVAGAGETGVVNGDVEPVLDINSTRILGAEDFERYEAEQKPSSTMDTYDYEKMRVDPEKERQRLDVFRGELEEEGVNSESVYAAIDAGEKEIEKGRQEALQRRNEERREDSRVPVGPNFARVEGMYEDTPAARDLSNFSLAKDLYDDARNLLDASFKGSGFGRGVWDAVYDVDAWTAGLTKLGKNVQLNRVYKKAKEGEELTASEARLLDAANYYTLAGALQQAYLPSTWYRFGKGFGESVPYMLEFALTYGPASSVTKGLARAVFKKLGGGTVGRVGGEVVHGMTTSAAQTPLNATNVVSGTYDRMMGNAEVATDENGVPVFMGMTDQKGFWQALGEATGAQYIENLSEVSGRMLSGAGHLIKRSAPRFVQEGLEKMADNRYVRAMADNAFTRGLRKVGKRFKIGNAPEEIYEEYFGGTINGLLIGDTDLESLYSMQSFVDITGTVAVTQVFLGVLGASMNHRSKRSLVKRYEKAEREYDALFSSPEERDMYVSYVNLNLNGVQGKGGKPMLTVLREAVEKMVNSKGDNFVRADGTFDTEAAKAYREEVSRVFGNYFVAKQLYDSYMAGIRTRKEADRERIATEMQEKAVNGQIMTVTLPDGRRARVVSGDIVVDGDGRIDVGRSGDHFTAVYEDDGSTVQLPVEDSYTVEVVSVEDAVEAASRANDEMINREEEEAVYGPRPKLGETVTMLDSEGNRVQLVVSGEVDESGNFMAMPMEDFDNNVKGMAVAVNMSQIVRDDAASEGVDGANEYQSFVNEGTVSDATVERIAGKIANGESLTAEEEAMRQGANERVEGALAKLRDMDLRPVGRGMLGDIYDQFKGRAKSAIEFLKRKKSGVAQGALHHKDIGDIDIAWGNSKMGLAHILEKHPNVVDGLQERLDDMVVVEASDNRVVLESPTHKAVVSNNWFGQKANNWLLTAYEKKSVSGGSIDIGPEPKGKQNGTAPLQNTLPESEGSEFEGEKQGHGGINGESGELASEGDAMAEAIGRNRFGTIYQWTRGKFKEAAAFLRKKQGGYIKGVFHRDDIGDIDMIWGNDKAGLKHIIQKHIVEHDDFDSVAEAMETINRVIENGTESKQGTNISFDHEGYRVSIAQSGEGNWVLTAFDMTRGLGEKKRFKGDATIGDQNTSYMENGTLVSPQLESSESEGSEFEGEKQGESALSRIEKDAKGQPLYEKADVETAWDALVEQSEGDESIARDVAASMVKDKEAALKKMEKAPAKGATPAEKIADAKVRKENIDKARAELEHWQRIAGVAGARVEGESEAVENTEKTGNSRIKQESEQQAYRETLERGDAGNAGYLLSDEVDENGRPFVLNSNGEIVFGEIGEDTGLTPAPILLSEGVITNFSTGSGYGLVHIEARHGEQIRNAGYKSVPAFVEEVAKNYERIKEGKDRAGNKTYMLQLTDKHNNTLMVELSGDESYWNVNSAGIFNTKYAGGSKVLYSRHTQTNQPVEVGEGSPTAEQSDSPTVASTLPSTTLSEGNESAGEKQGIPGKNVSGSPVGRSLNAEEADMLISQMERSAEVAPEMELTIENWDSEFGADGRVKTPIGEVKMGENQFTKLMRQGRSGKLGMVKPTLENPDIIIEDSSKAKDGEETERGSSYVYVKTFVKPDGSRYYYFTSVTVSRDGKEVVISNQEKRKSVLTNLLLKGKLVWKHADDVSTASDVADGLYSSQGNLSDPITEGTDAPQTNNSTSESIERIGEKQGKSEENTVISSEEDIDVTVGRVMEIPDAGDRSALVTGLLASAKAEEKSVSRVKNKVDPRNTQAFLAEQQRIRGEQDKARAEVAYWEEVKRIVEESNATESAPAETSKVKAARPKSIRERISALGEVLNLRDYILRALATGEYKFIWGDNRDGTKGLGSHLGFGNNRRGIEERQRRIWLLNNEEGLYPEQVAERLYANIQAEYPYLAQDDVEVFNEMLDVLRYDSAKDMVSEAEDMRRRREEMYEEYDSDQAMYDATMQERDERVDAENEAYRRELESQESGTPAEGRAAEPLGDTVVAAEAEVNTNPTEKQKEAEYSSIKTISGESRDAVTDNLMPNTEPTAIQGFDGYSQSEIKSIVQEYIQQKLDENDISANVVGIAIHGSRGRGNAKENSDLDVVVEYEGDIREDGMFNLLNDDDNGEALYIEGIRVDINPIRAQETGTLDKYMERSRKYDEEVLSNDSVEDSTVRYRRGEDGVQGVRRTQESEMEREVRGFGERMADRLGGGVRLVYSDEIADSEAHAEEKRRSKGYYDTATGEVVVVLDNNTVKGVPSVIEVAMTMMHEVVGHKGVRGLFGTKEDAFLDDVYRGMKARTKAEMESLYGGQLRRREGESEEAFEARRRRLMADEYIARVAEEGNNPGLLRRVGAKVRGLLRGLGVELAITDNEIRDILRRSARELTRRKDRAINVREDGDVRYRESVNERFNKELEQQIDGTLPKGHIYQLGLPGEILRSTGIPDLPIELSSARLAEKAAQRNHEFELSDVKGLPEALENPIAIFSYGNKDKAQNIIVEIEKAGKKFVVGLHLNQDRRGILVNDIRGIFPKDNAEWLNWISQGKLLYVDKNKIQDLIDKQRTNLAEVEYLDLDSITNIVENFENPTVGGENVRYRLTEEEQGIVEEAKRDGSYMKAPNGAPTRLTEKQWAQVRTRAFKAWFGDWEKAARIGKLRGSRPVEISGEEYKGKYELNRDSAKQWMKDNLRGEYTNKDTGEKIEISKVGVNKVTSHGERDEAHLKSIVAIPQLIGNSIFIDEHINEKGNDKYDSYRYYVCGLKIDGEDYTAKIVIGVKGDSKYYDHRLTQIEKGTLINNLNAMANHVAEKQNADVSISKDTKLLSILQVNSLKDVDENGEPTIFEPTGEVDKSNGDEESGVLYRKVTDMDTLKRLEEEPTIKVYRAMANIDGKLYPPMSTKIDGKLRAPIELGVWEEAEERPDLVDEKGNFKLKKDNGTTVPARYNPYIHTSRTPLNDQFSSAYKRPNLVTVEVEVPVSELTSGYHAEKAKDSVGEKSWHAGPVSGKLPTGKKRKVILSRWDKPIRIVPDEEVAKKISEILDGENIPIPYNVITPSLRKELEKLGVLIKDVGRDDIRYRAAEADYASVQDDASGEYAEALSAPMDISVADMMPIEAAENAQAAGLLRDVVNRFPDTKIAITDLSRVYAAAEVAEEEATEVRYRRGVNERFNEELERQIAGELPKGHVYSLGRPSEVLLAAGIPDLPIELAASRLGLKASAEYESNHPFELKEVMNLPEAIQHPIAVFDSKTRVGSKVILVELKDRNGNNFVVAMNTNVPNSRYSKASIQINSIRSIYPKDNVRDIVGWINRGDLLRYADKKKIEDWITQQRSNSADVEIQNLDVAANIVKEFENPKVGGENVRYRQGVNERFNDELQQQIDGTLPKGHVYGLGRPSEVLLSAGLPNLPIEMAASRLSDKSMQENHPYDLSEVKDLPQSIQVPMAVFRSATHIGSFVVMTEIEHRGRNFVVAIEANRKKGRIEINDIRSIHYRRTNAHIANWIAEGLLEYADKKRVAEWFSKQRYNSAEVRKLFNHAANIVKEFENPAVDGENVRYRRGISFDTRGASHRDTDITGRRERSFGEKASRLKEKAGISLYDEQLKLKQLQGKVAEWLTGSRKGALDDRLLFYEAENQAGSIAMDRKVRFDNEYRERLFALRAEVFKALGNKVDDKYYFYAKTLNERIGIIGEKAMAANKATMFSHLLSEQHPGHRSPKGFPEGFFDPKTYGYEALQEYARKEGWIDSIEGYIADCESRMGEKLVNDIWGVIGEIAEYQLTTSMKKGLITRDHFDRLMYGRPLAELVRENLEKGLITEGQYRAFLATDFTADELVKAGFITREQREGLKRRYEYYLPLKGDSEPTTEEVADYERSRSRVSWQIKSVRGGNTRLVNDPVSRLLADVYASISYQEKMAWIQSMYHALRLAERQGKGAGDFAILDNWVVKDETGDYVPYVRYVDGEPVFTPTEQEIAKGEVERARNLPIETAIRVPEAVQGEHIVKLKHRGRTIHIYFRDPAVANAVNNHFVPRNVPKLMKGLRAAGGFMGKVYTQWNIFFSVRNLSKDFGEAAINNYVQYGGRYMAEYMVNYWRVMRHAGTTLRGAKRSLVPTNDYERRVEEFFKYGGEVSYTQIESYDKAIRDFERELKRSADKRGVVSVTEAGFVKIGEAVSAANKLIELNARLATFITSRERGYGLRQSIRDAKEVTVNFDRRGRNSMEFGSLFLFWNAGRQSNRRKWELMRENPGRFWTSRAAMGLLNVAQTYVLGSALAAVFGVDWEDYMTGYYDIPDYIRYNNIVVMSADGKVYRIPLSPAFAPYKTLVENIGEATYRTAFNDRDGRYDWGKGMADIVKSVSADLGDLTTWEAEGGKRLIGWAPAPTVPLLEAMCNVDFTGRPVYKVGNSATPGYKRTYAGTKDVYVEITEWLNRVSGGEEAYGSWVGRRANPGAVQHVVEGYLGGLIQVLSKFWNVPEALKGASYERLPFVDTFYYGDAEMLGEREVRDDIYDARRLVESYNDVRSNFRKTDEDYDGNPKTVRFLENNEYRIDELKDLLKKYDEVTEELKSEDSEAYRRELRLLRRSIVELTNEMEEY